jgi:hypothetical protein
VYGSSDLVQHLAVGSTPGLDCAQIFVFQCSGVAANQNMQRCGCCCRSFAIAEERRRVRACCMGCQIFCCGQAGVNLMMCTAGRYGCVAAAGFEMHAGWLIKLHRLRCPEHLGALLCVCVCAISEPRARYGTSSMWRACYTSAVTCCFRIGTS